MSEPTYSGNRRIVLDHAHAFMAGVTWAMDHLDATPAEALRAAREEGRLRHRDASYLTEFTLGFRSLVDGVGDCVRRHTIETVEAEKEATR